MLCGHDCMLFFVFSRSGWRWGRDVSFVPCLGLGNIIDVGADMVIKFRIPRVEKALANPLHPSEPQLRHVDVIHVQPIKRHSSFKECMLINHWSNNKHKCP